MPGWRTLILMDVLGNGGEKGTLPGQKKRRRKDVDKHVKIITGISQKSIVNPLLGKTNVDHNEPVLDSGKSIGPITCDTPMTFRVSGITTTSSGVVLMDSGAITGMPC